MKLFITKWIWRFLKLAVIVLPKNKKLWVFGAWGGNLYADNTKYMFEYVNRMCPQIKAIWITKDSNVLKQVKSLGYRCYHSYSLRGIISWIYAGICFETEGNQDIAPVLGFGKQKIIQLWHGMGIKAVGLESGWNKGKSESEIVKEKECFEKVYSKWYWMCASEEAKQKYMRSFSVPEKQFIITGQPKDDTFINTKENLNILKIREKYQNARIAVYLPTHRNFGNNSEINNVLSLQTLVEINEKLKSNNIVIIFKPHFHEFHKYVGYEECMSNIIFATDKKKFGDVYEFLPYCDLMITDYSGIMFGYLASGKPIIYFPYDYEEYVKKDAGLYYSYDDITYGPICRTWDEVINNAAIITEEDYAEERERQRKRFCPYYDGKSCERVYQHVMKILE